MHPFLQRNTLSIRSLTNSDGTFSVVDPDTQEGLIQVVPPVAGQVPTAYRFAPSEPGHGFIGQTGDREPVFRCTQRVVYDEHDNPVGRVGLPVDTSFSALLKGFFSQPNPRYRLQLLDLAGQLLAEVDTLEDEFSLMQNGRPKATVVRREIYRRRTNIVYEYDVRWRSDVPPDSPLRQLLIAGFFQPF
jgi:hypothetical protein